LGKETVVGVDFGSRLMKICYAESTGPDRWRVTRTSFTPTPPDAVRDGVIVDRAAAASALRDLIRSANLSHITGANAAIAGATVIVRHVKMPKMQESVLRKSIPYEAAKHISASIDDSTIEFEIIGPVAGEPDKINVMLVAAPNEMINSRLATLEMAGLEPVAIDVEAFAVQHALLEIDPESQGNESTVAILDIGANSTDVTIVSNGIFALTRNISLAGDHFTNAIKNAKSCTFDVAEQIKQSVDMSALLSPDSSADDQAMAKMVQPTLDELLREVRRSINYYQSQVAEGSLALPTDNKSSNADGAAAGRGPSAGTVSKLVITGGSALLKGLRSYMEVRLGTTIEHWNIFEKSSIDSTQIAPSFIEAHHSLFALSTGLAVKQAKRVVPSRSGTFGWNPKTKVTNKAA
jgi:type IV pilus assembly protein PilM